jgi:dsDNA-specific endonuclease/ATPase MutS2
MFEDLVIIDNLPTLDLHGETCDIARVYINDFIKENYKLKNKYIVIIHGKGKGLIKNTLYEELRINKLVEDYKLYYFNDGCTIVKLKKEL